MAKTIPQLTALGATPDDTDNLVIDDAGVTKRVTAAELKGDCVRSQKNNALSTTVGTRVGTATNQLLGFWNATPISQPSNTTAIDSVLANSGLRASGGSANFATQVVASAGISVPDSQDIALGTSVGSKIGTATSQKIGFWNSTPVDQPALTADLLDSLQEVGLIASGAGNTPLNLSSGALACGAVTSTGAVTSSSSTGGVGYATGAGGAVTQLTSKSTGVTLSTVTGRITMSSASLGTTTPVSFTLTNSSISSNDLVMVSHVSGGTAGSYVLTAQAGAGQANIFVRNISGNALSEAIVIGFAVIKSVTS